MVSSDFSLITSPAGRHLVTGARVGFALTFTAITVLSLIPGTVMDDVNTFEIDDKIGHFIAYGTWGFFAVFAATSSRVRIICLVVMAIYGGILEIMQVVFAWDRDGSWLDLSADAAGVFAGAATALLAAGLARRWLR